MVDPRVYVVIKGEVVMFPIDLSPISIIQIHTRYPRTAISKQKK